MGQEGAWNSFRSARKRWSTGWNIHSFRMHDCVPREWRNSRNAVENFPSALQTVGPGHDNGQEMSQVLRLHQFPLSPFSRKVRIVLGEKRQQCEEIIERFWSPSADFLMLNPAGKVPVLKVEQAVLAESTAICEYS